MPGPPHDLAATLLAELGWVRRLAQSLVGDDAEDLTQEVATAALQRRPRPDGLRAWLGSVTRRQAARWRRNRVRRSQVEGAQAPQALAEDPVTVVEQLQRQRQLVQCVLDLAEPYRSVIVRRFFDGLAPGEIARRGDLPPATVRQQIRRGLAMLRERLERDAGPAWRDAILGLAVRGAGGTGALLGVVMMKKSLVAVFAVALAAVLWEVMPVEPSPVSDPSRADPGSAPLTADADSPHAGATEGEGARDRLEPTSADSLRVAVVTDRGVAVANARVISHCEGSIQVGLTDARGMVSLEAEPSAGCILIVPGDRPPFFATDVALAGQLEVALPGSGIVAGRVHVFDQPLIGRVRLELREDSATSLVQRLPLVMQQELGLAGSLRRSLDLRIGHLETESDSSGAFLFRGLPPGWSGRLRLSVHSPYLIRPKESSLQIRGFRSAIVPRATAGIVLALTRLPAVHGRIVWGDGTPVTGAGLTLSARYEGGHRSGTMGCRVVPDGTFRIGLRAFATKAFEQWLNPENLLAIERVHVIWNHRAAIRNRSKTVDTSTSGRDIDLGDLVLKRATTLHVLVCNPDGKPIARARVEGTRPSPRTDEDGRCVIQAVDVDCRTFRIAAPGCLTARYTAMLGTGTGGDPLRFVLRPGNRLTIQVHPGAFRLDGLKLELRSVKRIYTECDENGLLPSNMHLATGSTDAQSTTWQTPSIVSMGFRFDKGDKIELCSIVPGLSVRLRLHDLTNQVVLERHVRLPAAGQHQLIHLRPDAVVATIIGTVTLDGAPVEGARVKLPRGSIQSDRDGSFALHLLASGSPIAVTVTHPESVLLETELRLTGGVQRSHIHLTRGFDVDVRVVSADGIAVEARVRRAGAKAGEGRRIAIGHYRFGGLPAKPTTFIAEISGRKFERKATPTSEPNVEIRVPTLIRVRPRFPAGLDTTFVELALENTEHPERTFRRQFNLRASGRWLPAEVLLFPGSYRVSRIRDQSRERRSKPWSTVWTIVPGEKVIERRVLH